MKQYKYLYSKMLDPDLIRKAFYKMKKGKSKRPEVQAIAENLEAEIAGMIEMIQNTKPPGVPVPNPALAYKPAPRHPYRVFERGKWRTICKPEIHEQWLHHIIVLVLEPIVTGTSYFLSCGSFPKRGGHFGKRYISKWLRQKEKPCRYFAKADIRHFYDSVKYEILMQELSIRIKDDWFLYIVRICFTGFKKGLPLGFFISQWLANYILEPLDRMILGDGFSRYVRFMDDLVVGGRNKKALHREQVKIQQILGRRFRLKLKGNYQVFPEAYPDKRQTAAKRLKAALQNGKRPPVRGRPLDFMGFLFYQDSTILRKGTLVRAARAAQRLDAMKKAGRRFPLKRVRAVLSYCGYFKRSDTRNAYETRVAPYVNPKQLRQIVSANQRRKNAS